MLLQGAIGVAAGAILLRDRFEQSALASHAIDLAATKRVALQLLGVFFLVQGVASSANPTVGIFLVGTDWHFRASQFAEAAVLVISGALLVGRASRLATVLERRETASFKPRLTSDALSLWPVSLSRSPRRTLPTGYRR